MRALESLESAGRAGAKEDRAGASFDLLQHEICGLGRSDSMDMLLPLAARLEEFGADLESLFFSSRLGSATGPSDFVQQGVPTGTTTKAPDSNLSR